MCCFVTAAEPPVERLTKTGFPKFFLSYSPDGSHLTYSRHHDNRRAANKVLFGLRIVRADGTGDRALLPDFESSVQIQEHAAWSPDGRLLLITGGGNDTGNAAKDIFVCDVGPDFVAKNLRKLVAGAGVNVGEQAAWSPDGLEFAVVTTNRTLWVFSADGKTKRSILQAAGNYLFHPAWSPDGESIAFASDRDGNPDVYVIRTDGTGLTRLTDSPGIDCRPKWSPDGRWLAFASNRDGNDNLFVMRPVGTSLRPLTEHSALDDHPAWSPDGRWLSFVSMRDGGFDIYRLPVPADLQVAQAPQRKPRPKPAAEVPADGLVVHYTFEEGLGKTLRDATGKHTLELTGATLAKNEGRGVLELNGRDAFASAGNPDALHISEALTLAVRVRPDHFENNGYVLSKHGWNIYIGGDYIPRFETRNAADTAWDTLPAEVKLPQGKWSHLAAVFDPAKKRLAIYVDGKLSATKERTDGKIGAVAGYPLELGRYNAGRSQYLGGALDDVRIYRRVLTDDEIGKLARRE